MIRQDKARCSAATALPRVAGGLTSLESRLPHPDGMIEFSMELAGEVCRVDVTLPAPLEGVLNWQGRDLPIAGRQNLELPR